MRLAPALIGFAALAFASAAQAQNVTLSPVAFSPEFQTELEEEIGVREGEYLREQAARAVNNAIARRNLAGGPPVRIEISILDAQPNKPTMQQLRNQPALDWGRSVSTGGADLRAVLYTEAGQQIAEVQHDYYSRSLVDLFVEPNTWTDARRAIRQFAERVADAYAAYAGAPGR